MEHTIWAREKDPATNKWTAYFNVEAPGRRNSHLKGPFKLNIKGQWITLQDNGIPASTIDQAKKLRNKYDAAEEAKAKGVELPSDSGDGKPLKLAVQEFLDIKKRKSPATVENYTFILQQFVEYMLTLGVRSVEQVNRKIIGQYIDWLEETEEYAPKTIENKTMVVVFMLKDAGVEEPYTKFNIGDLLPTVEDEPAEPYSETELKKLFGAMDTEECVRYTFFLITACREKEVAHARWEDIVTDSKGLPHYRVRAKEYIGSNGEKTKFSPKNHEQRMIPITSALVEMLTKRKKESKSEWIFPNEDGFPEGHFLRKFKRIAFETGLNCGKCEHEISAGRNRNGHAQAGEEAQKKQVSCGNGPYCDEQYLHRLRKTRATAWHREHVDLRTIQHYLGHKSLETTQKYLGISDAAAVQDKINKPMF
jgi:integrase